MHTLRKLLREIHRRSVWQVLGIYVGGSWVALQAVDFVTGFAGLPAWTTAFALVLLFVGLPIVLATAIVQKGGPGRWGEYRDEVDPNELVGRTPAEVYVAPRPPLFSRERLFTWRNAILGGVGAAALLIGSVVAYLVMWATGIGPIGSLVAQGMIAERDPVILADFEDRTAEAALGGAMTEAFRVDLAQSEVVTLVDVRVIQDVLRRMGRPPGAGLDAAVAREVALREGVGAVVEGDVSRVGGGYLLATRIVVPDDGHALAAFRENAVDDDDLLPAIDRLSERVREKIGESLRQVRAGQPLEAVTTSSLEALRRFAEAGRADGEGEVGRAIDLLNEAVALDAGFAMAWRRLAVIHGNRGADRAATVQAATRAHEGRERLTERERQLAAAFYHRVVTGDLEEVVRAYRLVLDAHPDDPAALDNLASAYMERERWGEAVDLLERTVAGPSRSRSAYANLVVCLYNVGRIEEAFAALDRWVGVYPPDFAYRRTKAILLLGTGDVDGAQAEVDEGVAALDADLVGRLRLGELGARIAHARGKLDDAERRLREGMAVADAQGLDVDVIWFGMGIARVRTSRGADPVAELGSLDREAERRLERMPALDRPYHEVGLGWAVHARDADRAEAWWRRLVEATTPAVQEEPTFANQALYRRQWLSLLRGRPADALRDLRELRRRRPCARCDLREAALAFEALQQPDSAIASLERWLAGEDFDLVVERAEWRGEVLDVLAGLYEEVGRVADARDAWLRLAEHWADADDALRQRANAAGRRAAELAERSGRPGGGGS